MIGNDAEAGRVAQRLQELIALGKNPIFQTYYQQPLAQAHEAMLDGLSDKESTSERRGEHLEGYHLAKEFAEKLEALTKATRQELADWQGRLAKKAGQGAG